jgi:hypothetical protein
MKYLKPIHILLEAVDSYNWELSSVTDNKVRYNFEDIEENKYLVEFKSLQAIRRGDLSAQWELTYYVFSNGNFSVSKVVNVNPYKVLKTIFDDILNDFIKRNSWVKVITFFGLSKDQEKSYVSQRTRMYVRYLQRNPISGYRMENFGNKINLIKI